jgi:hypothetical protein
MASGRSALEKDTEPNAGYIAFHRPRFTFLIDLLRHNVRTTDARILDVGRSYLTTMMHDELGTRIDSLGLEPEQDVPSGHHYCFDLNDAQYRERWRTDIGPYDVIVFAEVIEHLYTAPELVIGFLSDVLVPNGSLLLQTPNAVSLSKRVKLGIGVNPFEPIRVDRLNPGHYREYTLDELVDVLTRSRFSIEKSWRKYYFDVRYAKHEMGTEKPKLISGAIRNVAYRLLPPSLREGITVLARKRADVLDGRRPLGPTP